MKIQEMKSGILHLNKKMGIERQENDQAMSDFGGWESAPEPVLPTAEVSELEEPRWSVISFDRREAGNLTYQRAASLMSDLDSRDISGLCIVTDDAASRLRN